MPAAVDILYLEGCPSYEGTLRAVERVAERLGVEPDVRLVRVAGEADAERMRFLGSPTVRVDGRDVEPGADERAEYVFACRVYRDGGRLTGEPPERWIRDALTTAYGYADASRSLDHRSRS